MTEAPLPIIGVVGAGTMGAGIAQLALEHGHEVVLHDVDEAAIARGRERIRDGLERRAIKLGLDAETVEAWIEGRLGRLREAETLAGLGGEVDVAIEAALEDLELKREIFRALDAACSADTILATNTSALSVTAIAAVTSRPERVVGLHFFNPAPVMKLVEVVTTPLTQPAIADRAAALVASWDRTPIRCSDVPGFVVNRVNRPFTLEALRMLEAGDGSVEEIDAAIRAAGFPMGPFELMDLIGIDVNLAAARGLHDAFLRMEPQAAERFRPSPIQERLAAEGRFGRKSAVGFYRYADGRATGPADEFAVAPPAPVAAAAIRDRITLAIVAEAYRAVESGVASAEDVDLALRLGAGHPTGPFALAAELTTSVVLRRLRELSVLGPRFEPPRSLVEAVERG